MSTRFKLLGLGAVALLTAAVLWTASAGPFGRTKPEPTPAATAALASPSASLPPLPTVTSYPDQALGPDSPPDPTGVRAQSKLWLANGSWWAVMVDPTSKAYRIYELVDAGKSWRDTGTVVDERPLAQPDALWDGTHLYIASGVHTASASGAAELSRFSFDAKNRRFALDPNFPVPITPGGVESIVLTRDTTAKLWTAYIAEDGQVMINRTLGNDLFWGQPFALPVDHSLVTKDDVATILAYGSGRVGVMWSSRADSSFYLSSHEDGDPENTWGAPEVALTGQNMASGQLKAMAAPDGRLFAAVKTAVDDDPASNGHMPQVMLLARAVDGAWTNVLYGRLQEQHVWPAVALDVPDGMLYVVATTPKHGGTIDYKRTSADDPAFEPGLGQPFISDPTATTLGRATSTKDPVTPQSGLVFLAYDPVTFRYVHGVMDLGGGVQAGTLPARVAAPTPRLYFLDDFDPWPVGSTPNIGWKLRPNDPPRAFAIVPRPSMTDRSASIVAPTVGRDVQACKSFPPAKLGDLTVDVRVRLARGGATDATVTDVRGATVDAASVHFGRNGFFAYYKGPTKIRTLVPIRYGTWYRSIVVVHPATRTYDWRLLDATGRLLINARGLAWRKAGPALLDKVCLRTPTGGRGIGLDWDDISVIR